MRACVCASAGEQLALFHKSQSAASLRTRTRLSTIIWGQFTLWRRVLPISRIVQSWPANDYLDTFAFGHSCFHQRVILYLHAGQTDRQVALCRRQLGGICPRLSHSCNASDLLMWAVFRISHLFMHTPRLICVCTHYCSLQWELNLLLSCEWDGPLHTFAPHTHTQTYTRAFAQIHTPISPV